MDYSEQLDDLARNWKPPIELTRSGPRSIGFSTTGKAVVGVAVLLLIGGIFLAAWLGGMSRRQAAERRLLDEQGRDLDAAITRLWRSDDKEQAPMVAYTFDWEGHGYKGKGSLPLRVWRRLTVDSPLPVRFLPSRPQLNRPVDSRSRPLPFWVAILLGTIASAAGGLLIFAIRRQMALLLDGRPAPGVITSVTRGPEGKKFVHYQFRVLSGSTVKGKWGPTHRPKPLGTTLCIVYDRDNPSRNSTYPMSLVRVKPWDNLR